jgi:small ligand-binding sensory domain FIST
MDPTSAFIIGHATHPDWRAALALATAQLQAAVAVRERAARPRKPSKAAASPGASAAAPLTLGFVYFTDHYAAHARPLVQALQQQWPGLHWVGSVGVGVAAQGVEYIDEPALVLMLAPLPASSFEVFSGARKLQMADPFCALVHADPATPDMAELIAEMSARTRSGYLFGGLASSRGAAVHVADGAWRGGLSGVAFTGDVALVSRVTQGCQPLAATRRITACEGHIVLRLDDRPALECLLQDLGLDSLDDPRKALPRLRATLVGLTDETDHAQAHRGGGVGAGSAGTARPFGTDTRVRHLIGLDPQRQAVAVADTVRVGMRLAFCQRDAQAARRDLVRICSEIRDELETPADESLAVVGAAKGTAVAQGPVAAARPILGAVYISCSGRGGPHFGGPSAELQIVQHALAGAQGGEVPLVGFFAAGEIARHHLYGYTGVLTVFTVPA